MSARYHKLDGEDNHPLQGTFAYATSLSLNVTWLPDCKLTYDVLYNDEKLRAVQTVAEGIS